MPPSTRRKSNFLTTYLRRGQTGIYTRPAHNRKERGEKERTARVLLVYSQPDKSKREIIEKHGTRHKVPILRLKHPLRSHKEMY